MPKTNKIALYGEIGFGDITAKKFSALMKTAAKDSDRIALHIHSPGGEVIEGNLIYNIIKQSKVPVDVYIDGLAASMASVIMLAADNIYMAKNAFVMTHSPSTIVWGNAELMEKVANHLRESEKQFIEGYADKTGKSTEDVAALLNGDNWFSAQQAKEYGLVDDIFNPEDVEPVYMDENDFRVKEIYDIYNEYKVKAKLDLNINKIQIKQELKMEKLLAALGLATGAAEDNIVAAIERLKVRAERADVLEKEKVEAFNRSIEDTVAKAITERKITADKKDTYIEIGKASGIESLKEVLSAITAVPDVKSQLNIASISGASNKELSDKWDKLDKEGGLAALKDTDAAAYQQLFDAKFNKGGK